MSDLAVEGLTKNWYLGTQPYSFNVFHSNVIYPISVGKNPILNFIPKYALAEFVGLIVGFFISLFAFVYTLSFKPDISNVFLIPLFISLAGIVFIIVKRP